MKVGGGLVHAALEGIKHLSGSLRTIGKWTLLLSQKVAQQSINFQIPAKLGQRVVQPIANAIASKLPEHLKAVAPHVGMAVAALIQGQTQKMLTDYVSRLQPQQVLALPPPPSATATLPLTTASLRVTASYTVEEPPSEEPVERHENHREMEFHVHGGPRPMSSVHPAPQPAMAPPAPAPVPQPQPAERRNNMKRNFQQIDRNSGDADRSWGRKGHYRRRNGRLRV
ncbi:hypothetical protein HK102_005244 [Quaeritorhiza haematococci]|nr:hypothetical protein HK102_005244 [Quaeritorhiza haematococci]